MATALRTVAAVCRDRRTTHAKALYEASLIEDDDDEGMAAVATLAHANLTDFEHSMTVIDVQSVDEACLILCVAQAIIRDYGDCARVALLLSAANRGLNCLAVAPRRRAA